MNTWNRLCAMCVVMLCAEQTFAGDSAEATKKPLFWKFQTTTASKFVGYIGYQLSTGPVFQNELSVVAPSGWKAGVWWSTGTNDTIFSSDTSDEIQWTLGWTRTFSRTTLAAEIVYMDFMPLNQSKKDVVTPRLRLGRTFDIGVVSKFAIVLQVEDRVSIPTRTERPTVTLAVNDTVKLTQRWSVVAGVNTLYDHGSPTADNGILLRWTGELSVAITPRITGTAFVRSFNPVTIEDKRTQQNVFGVGVTITF